MNQTTTSKRIAADIERGRALRAFEQEKHDAAMRTQAQFDAAAAKFRAQGDADTEADLLHAVREHARAMDALRRAMHAA